MFIKDVQPEQSRLLCIRSVRDERYMKISEVSLSHVTSEHAIRTASRPSAEVFHQHDVTATLVLLRKKHPALVR